MTEYFIFLPGDNPNDIQFDPNVLGTESFGTFYAERGMETLENIVERHPEMLQDTTIVTDTGIKFTITEFLDKLNRLKVLFN